MKKSLIFAGLLTSIVVTAQYEKRVGINTDKPRASLEVSRVTITDENKTKAQGILFPHISDAEKKNWQPNETTGLVAGTVIWNTDLKCLDYFDGEKWQCTDGSNPYYPPVNPTTDKTVKADVWDRTHYIGSFNHNGANIDGELGNIDGDGNIDGNILKLQIPYNQATVGGEYKEINVKRTIKDRNGKNILLTLNIPEGTFNQAEGFLNATIKVGSGATSDVYKVKQLPANEEETITTFAFSINGNVSNVKLVASGGVLDKKFNVQTNNKLEHQFIYVPVSVYDNIYVPPTGQPYEKKWLNNNLGANYANLDKTTVFNPTKQAQSHDDYNAYGSLFQWQRPADGHELVNWTSSTTADLTPTTTILWGNTKWAPNHSKYIIVSINSNSSWVTSTVNTNTSFHNLWQSGQPNNPCPQGYHPPTTDEWGDLYEFNPNGDIAYDYWMNNHLKLPPAPVRGFVNVLPESNVMVYSAYWASMYLSAYWSGGRFLVTPTGASIDDGPRSYGHSVRCIAE